MKSLGNRNQGKKKKMELIKVSSSVDDGRNGSCRPEGQPCSPGCGPDVCGPYWEECEFN